MTMANPGYTRAELREFQHGYIDAITQATSEIGKLRITRDLCIATMPRRGLVKLAKWKGVPLAEMYRKRQQARDRLRAASHKLEAVEGAVASLPRAPPRSKGVSSRYPFTQNQVVFDPSALRQPLVRRC
jgi:hypothetical protein